MSKQTEFMELIVESLNKISNSQKQIKVEVPKLVPLAALTNLIRAPTMKRRLRTPATRTARTTTSSHPCGGRGKSVKIPAAPRMRRALPNAAKARLGRLG